MKLRLAISYSSATPVPQGKCSGAKLKTFQGFSAGKLLNRNKVRSLCHITAKNSGADELPGLLMVDGQVLPLQV